MDSQVNSLTTGLHSVSYTAITPSAPPESKLQINNGNIICTHVQKDYGMVVICDAIKQNESELKKNKNSVFISIVSCNIRAMLKTTTRLNIQFQRYSHFSDAQNNKIQRKLNTIIG